MVYYLDAVIRLLTDEKDTVPFMCFIAPVGTCPEENRVKQYNTGKQLFSTP
jgi:hypothetical protein